MEEMKKKCPKCLKVTDVEKHFGYRLVNGMDNYVQSYCTSCRNKKILEPERECLKREYRRRYPNDKCLTRSINFMKKKLARSDARV